MRDWELENLAVDDIETALKYIGEKARYKNHFLANKQKTDSLYTNSLLHHKILNNPKPLTKSKPCL
ncbi:hypothetical protein QUB70_28145 [Microcoleus sp. A003_D6]